MGDSSLLHFLSVVESFFNNNHASIAIMDRNFNFIKVNELYAQGGNRGVNDYPGHNHFEFFPSADTKKIFENVVSTKEPFQMFACPFINSENPERGLIYFDWKLDPVLDDEGEVQLLVLTMVNVSEQKYKEDELERFFELSPDLLSVVDNRFVIKRINQSVKAVLGYSKYEIIGKKGIRYVHKDDIHNLLEKSRRQIALNLPVVSFVSRLRCKDGNYKWIEFSNSYIREKKQFYSIGRDITEKIKTQKEMTRLDQLNLIGQMAAGIGHEVRNPMTTVRGFLQMLSEKEDCSQYKGYFGLMIEELDRANAIITQYLTLAKTKESALEKQNLNNIITELYPLLQADALNSNNDISFEKEQLPEISINKKEIHQLILNLVRNGLEAMQSSGSISLKTYLEADEIVLEVKDQGPGIDRSIIDKLGTPFFTTKPEGTGLGLATCYSIAERNNARIELETSSSGTTFYVRFGIQNSEHKKVEYDNDLALLTV